jgi:hypothetical protein
LFSLTSTFKPLWKSFLWVFVFVTTWLLIFLLPSSVLRGRAYTAGPTYFDENLTLAREVLAIAPKGVMLAPYPLSGAINMLDSGRPQLEARDNILEFFLTPLGQDIDAGLRIDANAFLTGDPGKSGPFEQLLGRYPEIQSLVLYERILQRPGYLVVIPNVEQFFKDNGFVNSKDTPDVVVFWK